MEKKSKEGEEKRNVTKREVISWIMNGVFITLMPIGYDYLKNRSAKKEAEIEAEKQLLIETSTKRTIHYNETINYYYDEMGQLIQEKETVEKTVTILDNEKAELLASNNTLKSEVETLDDSLKNTIRYADESFESLSPIKPTFDTKIPKELRKR